LKEGGENTEPVKHTVGKKEKQKPFRKGSEKSVSKVDRS